MNASTASRLRQLEKQESSNGRMLIADGRHEVFNLPNDFNQHQDTIVEIRRFSKGLNGRVPTLMHKGEAYKP